MTDHSVVITSATQNFIAKLGLPAEVTVATQYDSTNDLYQILLTTTDPALLIGFHGETLSSIQLILGQHLHAQLGEWLNLSLNVNDYRERRESAINTLIQNTVTQVLSTKQPHVLPPMPASERRLVHMYLADHPQVSTASDGVGRSRSVVISPK